MIMVQKLRQRLKQKLKRISVSTLTPTQHPAPQQPTMIRAYGEFFYTFVFTYRRLSFSKNGENRSPYADPFYKNKVTNTLNNRIDIGSSFLIFLFFFSQIPIAEAQKYDFKHYSVTNGLAHGQVSSVFQSKSQHMWFGTMGGGISKFNGSRFKTFTHSNGLRDNYITALAEDRKQNIWVSTYEGGVGKLAGDSLEYQFKESPLDTAIVYNIRESPSGNLWFATYGAGAFVLKGSNLRQLTTELGLTNNYVWDFWFDESGKVWISTDNGVSIYDNKEVYPFSDNDKLNGENIYRVHQDPDNNTWFATNNGVTRFDGDKFDNIYTINEDSLGSIFDIIHDRYGDIWIGTASNGIYRQFSDENFHQITTDNGLSSDYIYNLYKDPKGKIWVATDESGVNLFRGDEFIWGTDDESNGNQILSIKNARSGELWVGTADDGLWKAEYRGGKFVRSRIGLKEQEVWDIEKRENGNLLLLTGDNSIWEYDGQSYVNINKKFDFPPPYTIDIFVDSSGKIWIGTDEGIYHIEGEKVRHLTEKDGLTDNFIWEIKEDRNGNLWISTERGISKYNGHSFTNFTMDDGLNQNVISSIVQDEEDNFWIGTTAGISYYKPSTQQFINFDSEDGMEYVNTQFIAFDSQGYLWQGTSAGLQKLNVPKYKQTDKMEIVTYDYGKNRDNFEFAHKAVEVDSNGHLWFGSTTGLLRYNPEKVRIDSSGPEVTISNISNHSQNINPSVSTPEAEFGYEENDISVDFSALEYEYPERIIYRYQLDGLEDEWSEPSKINEAIFRNLDSGRYNFIVQARNHLGHWGPKASVGFSVNPPFWNTYWFYAVVVASLIGLIYTYIRVRVNILEKNRLQELVDFKTSDLQRALDEKEVLIKEIHHRVKNNLAVISGLLELQMGYSDDKYSEQVLLESKRRVQSIAMIHEKLYQNENLSEINFQTYIRELLDVIVYSVDPGDKTIDLDLKIDQIHLGIDQAIPCGLILNELVSNAYEHAFKENDSGEVMVEFLRNGNKIHFKVSDDGIGMPTNGDGNQGSLGLTLVNALVKQLEGELKIDTSAGTSFLIQFEKDHQSDALPM